MIKFVKYSLISAFTVFILLPILLLMLVNFYDFVPDAPFDENGNYIVKEELSEYYKWREPKESDEVYQDIVNYYSDMIDEEEILKEITSTITNPLKVKAILTDTFGDNIPNIQEQ